jgi:hypothetical protein
VFYKKFATSSNWYFRPVEGGTEATWTLESDFPYPFNAMLLVMNFPEMMNKDYDEGLAFLKTYVENN